MAWSENINIHNHIHNDSKETIALLREIRDILKGGDQRVKELEAQMDGWLLTLKKGLDKLEVVSDKVDSTK